MKLSAPYRPHYAALFFLVFLFLVAAAEPATAQAVAPGAWDVTSTVRELSVPGVPGFLQRLARGKAKTEHKRLIADQGVEALLAPDAKARCRIESQSVANGRYAQALTCPQKTGEPMHVSRAGTYDAAGLSGRAIVTGTTAKGPLTIILDQRAVRVGG